MSVQFTQLCLTFVTPWTAARQASLSITNSQSSLKLMSIELVMPSNHLILYCPLLLLPSIFPSIKVFSKESALCIRWPKYWSFSFNISPSNEHSGLISSRRSLVRSPCSPRDSQPSSPTPQFKSIICQLYFKKKTCLHFVNMHTFRICSAYFGDNFNIHIKLSQMFYI